MKARAVRKLDPDGPLAENLARIVKVRLDEVYDLARKAVKPGRVKAQHDMRIAVKRLRYVLELSNGCFGVYTRTAVRRTKELQDLLGEIHDCDVVLPRVLDRLEELREADTAAVLAEATGAAGTRSGARGASPQRSGPSRPRHTQHPRRGAARAAVRALRGRLGSDGTRRVPRKAPRRDAAAARRVDAVFTQRSARGVRTGDER